MASSDPVVVPIVGGLRVVGGARLDAGAVTAEPPPPARVAPGREGERLFILVDVEGSQALAISRTLMEVVAQAYWATGGSITTKGRIDDRRGTTHTGLHRNGRGGTISGTCPAFHACIPALDMGMAVIHVEDGMGTHVETHPASHTFFFVQDQRGDILQIN